MPIVYTNGVLPLPMEWVIKAAGFRHICQLAFLRCWPAYPHLQICIAITSNGVILSSSIFSIAKA